MEGPSMGVEWSCNMQFKASLAIWGFIQWTGNQLLPSDLVIKEWVSTMLKQLKNWSSVFSYIMMWYIGEGFWPPKNAIMCDIIECQYLLFAIFSLIDIPHTYIHTYYIYIHSSFSFVNVYLFFFFFFLLII